MQKFIIAGTQRTGTSLIRSTIGKHPDIYCMGELLLFSKGRGKRTENSYRQFINKSTANKIRHYFNREKNVRLYMDEVFRPEQGACVGFKLMLDQVQAFPAVGKYLIENKVAIIHVVRENVLKTHVSRVSAKTRKMYHSTENVNPDKILLPTDSLVSRLDDISAEAVNWRDIVGNNPYLRVNYEDFTKDKAGQLSNVLTFLGLEEKGTMESDLKKINQDDLRDVIENFDQVEQVLSGSNYESMLHAV